MADEALNTAIDERALAEAHQRMMHDGAVQFELPVFKQPELPSWLRPVLEWLAHSGPVVKFLFWAGLVIIVLLVLRAIYGWLAPVIHAWMGRTPAPTDAESWAPDAAPARALLAEADALAVTGAFAEAAHLLLLRSVEQIEARYPGRLRPSWTSRDILRFSILPPQAQRAFGFIAATVETSIFGQRPVDAAAWSACRSAYETAAFGASS